MNQPLQPAPLNNDAFKSQRQLTMVIYALYGAGYFLGGIPAIVAIIINHIKRNEIKDPMLVSHFTWQIRTFWITLGLCIFGVLTALLGIGFVIFFAAMIWNIYRLVRGVLNLIENKPMRTPHP